MQLAVPGSPRGETTIGTRTNMLMTAVSPDAGFADTRLLASALVCSNAEAMCANPNLVHKNTTRDKRGRKVILFSVNLLIACFSSS